MGGRSVGAQLRIGQTEKGRGRRRRGRLGYMAGLMKAKDSRVITRLGYMGILKMIVDSLSVFKVL